MTTAIHYDIDAFDPYAHIFKVTLTMTNLDAQGLKLQLPAWIPGSYMIREFAKNIIQINASCLGEAVAIEKIDKQTWQLAPCKGLVKIEYDVYAYDLSVRTAHLDQTHAFFNGSSVFLQALGFENLPHIINIHKPSIVQAQNWRVATALTEANATRYGFGTYMASNYDELIDCPVEISDFTLGQFKAHGVNHDIAITGKVPNLDLKRVEQDLKRICETEIEFFEPITKKHPASRYVFLVMVVANGYGGLEHRNSTALLCSRDSLPIKSQRQANKTRTTEYTRFLGLCSHEYFHTWNVKRIKPQAFVHYDLTKENYTDLLWVFEGFTSYYDDLTLLRSQLIDTKNYLQLVSDIMNNVMRGNGHLKQTVAQASFDAWIKYYRQDENSPNATVSYYTKGALVAMALDLTIRLRSEHTRSLDDVMRTLWQRFGVNFYQGQATGVTRSQVLATINEIATVNLNDFFENYVFGTKSLPLQYLLSEFGITLTNNTQPKPGLNIRVKRVDNDCVITHVFENGSAHLGGISAGDTLIAIDGFRVSGENLLSKIETLLAAYEPGQTVTVHVFRRDELMALPVIIHDENIASYALALDETDATKANLRTAWLNTPTAESEK